jgi:phage-related protein (TIGR01555 family)
MTFWRKPKRAPTETPTAPSRVSSWFSTHAFDTEHAPFEVAEYLRQLPRPKTDGAKHAMDDYGGGDDFKIFGAMESIMSGPIVGWYASQSFISHQLAGIVAQHWLVNKACSVPARDAVRKGYNIVTEDGDDLDKEAVRLFKLYDRRFGIRRQLVDFIRKGRIFGIRIAMFKVESTDKEYYEKPFNLDGVTKGSYKGIVQVDPYWTAPLLDGAAAAQPDSLHFYEPTWWIINGQKVHRTHLCIYRHEEVVDVLKPQYLYGGVPLPQQIMERVYAGERTANEAPELAMTKRTSVWLTDMEQVMANSEEAVKRLNEWVRYRNSYGVKLGDKENDQFEQFDTTLADFDSLIMTQYQLVAAIACMPATKLLGTSPKGFGASGEYEESSYHELLESIQDDALTPLLERHHALVMRSFIAPKGGEAVATTITWNPLDTPTAKELAETNLAKAQIGNALVQSGAITSEDERRRVATDKESGYHALGLSDIDADADDPQTD